MLFLQSYKSGTIAPKEGEDGRFTLSLEQGLGQTVYFSNRPDRIVGASPTADSLDGLGFPDDNPPNAALVIETDNGETDVAVVELFNPVYDPADNGVTYDITVLANWQTELKMDFSEAPTDLATLDSDFGAAHLFIDDCSDRGIVCVAGNKTAGEFMSQGFCYWWRYAGCYPCENGGAGNRDEIATYWEGRCNETYAECNGQCSVIYAGPLICEDPRGCN